MCVHEITKIESDPFNKIYVSGYQVREKKITSVDNVIYIPIIHGKTGIRVDRWTNQNPSELMTEWPETKSSYLLGFHIFKDPASVDMWCACKDRVLIKVLGRGLLAEGYQSPEFMDKVFVVRDIKVIEEIGPLDDWKLRKKTIRKAKRMMEE